MNRDIQLSENKSFGIQTEFGKNSNFNPFEFLVKWTTKQDHAGFRFVFGIYGLFWISIEIYDHRHWNYEKDRWYLPGEVIFD
jgi:hypothetical protein